MVKISNLDPGKVKPVCPFGISKKTLKLFRMGLFLEAYVGRRGWEGKKDPPFPKICHISYNEGTWHSYTLVEEDPKNT